MRAIDKVSRLLQELSERLARQKACTDFIKCKDSGKVDLFRGGSTNKYCVDTDERAAYDKVRQQLINLYDGIES